MLASDIYSNSVAVRYGRFGMIREGCRGLLSAVMGWGARVPALHSAQELAYLGAATNHQDLERRLSMLENRHQLALCQLQSWPD
ncbi:hypothetical protein [Undibacterium sp.]|jgi:hypothetical protein|uniref:hypothetical protein n=1 Tax=Undibacterium sp. TaxID=1914977 RepID=UPI002C5C9449|nr:hypothetical protein [Undibacterium sp.]HTD03588.1 hypothetical protein [Undibacterium sp.]